MLQRQSLCLLPQARGNHKNHPTLDLPSRAAFTWRGDSNQQNAHAGASVRCYDFVDDNSVGKPSDLL
jgi:hypothetical protein